LQPSEAFRLLDYRATALVVPARRALQELAFDQPEDAAVQRVHGQHRMQVVAAPAYRVDGGRVLYCQHVAPLAAPSRPLGGFGHDLLHADGAVAQEPR